MATKRNQDFKQSLKRFFCIITVVLLISALSSMTFFEIASANRGTPLSPCCEGGDCCILSDCLCPNCEDRGDPGEACNRCGDALCANCGNCYDCGTSPCPLCRDYCFMCGSFDLCNACNGCKDCGHNRDSGCPECGEELLPADINNIYWDMIIEDGPIPLFSGAGFEFFLFAPFGMSAGAILSLLFTLAGVVFSLITIICTVRQKKGEHKEFEERTAELNSINSLENVQLLSALENEEFLKRRRRSRALFITLILSLSAVLLLVLMQNFTGVIVLFDWWVIVHSIIFAGVLLFGKLAFKRHNPQDSLLYQPSLS